MRKTNVILLTFLGIFTAGLIAGIVMQNQAVVSSGPSVMDTTQDLWSGGIATAAGMAAIILFAVGVLFNRATHKRKESMQKTKYTKAMNFDLHGWELWGATFSYGAALYSIIMAIVFMFAF